jgi:NSS family neurotransmitter:Na+ symporter
LPIGGLFITIFVGWVWGKNNALLEMRQGADRTPNWFFSVWRFLIRYVAPVLIAMVLLSSLGII